MDVTVAMLREYLSAFPDEFIVSFGGLDFYRVKQRGPDVVQIEFDQTVYRDAKGQVVVQNHEASDGS